MSTRDAPVTTDFMKMDGPDTAFGRGLRWALRHTTVTSQEIARLIGCNPDHVNSVARGDSHFSLKKAEIVSGYLLDEHGITRHLEGFCGTRGDIHFRPGEVDNDDDIRPEVMDARNDCTNAIEALDRGDREEAAQQIRDGIGDLHEALQDIQNPA